MASKQTGSEATITKQGWCSPRERETVRQAILDAAGRIVSQRGAEALTLSAVASEAGIARATLYGYFTSKQDLVAHMGLTSVSDAPGEPSGAEEAREEQAAETPTVEPTADQPASGAATETAEIDAPFQPVPESDYDGLMKKQAEALDKLAKRLLIPKSMMKEGTDAVLTRLEARLGVVEQTYASLERRVADEYKNLAGQAAAVTDAAQQLQKRVETFENRQHMALAEIRLDVHNLAHPQTENAVQHQEAVIAKIEPPADTPMRSAPAEPAIEQPAVLKVVDMAAITKVDEKPAEAMTVEPSESKTEQTTQPDSKSGYISTARRAAIDAAQRQTPKKRPSRNKQLAAWRWALGVMLLFALGVAAFLLTLNTQARVQPASGVLTTRPIMVHKSLAALAAAGDPRAEMALGLKLMNGTGVPINAAQGTVWLTRAAAAGLPEAENIMGVLYQTGTGVSADMPRAIRWYSAAAEHGNVKAMANLGKAYAGGWSEGTDYAAAARWLSRAAAYGDVDAEFDLAILYERGKGVPRSLADAYTWYAIAAAQGDKHAAARAPIIAGELAPAELRAAQATATAFRRRPLDRSANDGPAADLLAGSAH